jgi:hypothetical protein
MILKETIFIVFISVMIFGCRKGVNNTAVDLSVSDIETGKPIAGATVILSYMHSDYKNNAELPVTKIIGQTDQNGKFFCSLNDLNDISDENKQGSVIVYSDLPKYAMEIASITAGQKTSKTFRLTSCAEILIKYIQDSAGHVLNNIRIGINKPDELPWNSPGILYDLYYAKNNLDITANAITRDTAYTIYCNPASTYQFYYSIPGGFRIDSVKLKPREKKQIIVSF